MERTNNSTSVKNERNANKQQNSMHNEKYSTSQTLVNYYLALMFALFPVFFSNSYFDIRHDKYYFFIVLSGVIVFAVFTIYICKVFSDTGSHPQILTNTSQSNYRYKGESSKFSGKNSRFIFKGFNLPDIAMLVFLVASLISAIFSKYKADAFLGAETGRNNGLLIIAIYVAVYFVITRYFYFMEYIFYFLSASCIIVFTLAVLNTFYIDPLSMFVNISNEQTINDFISTIGNKNMLSSFICITLPVLIALAVLKGKGATKILFYVASGLGFAGLMVSTSDSGLLGICAFLLVFLIIISRKVSLLKRFFLTVSIMLAFSKSVAVLSYLCNDTHKEIDKIQSFFIFSNRVYIILAVALIITAILFFVDYKKPDLVFSKAVPISLSIILVLAIVSAVYLIIYYSFFDLETNLGNLERYLRFNEKWGTHRGYMWISSIEIFTDSSIWQKLFGCGPDTFYHAFEPYFSGLHKFGDSSTNAAHNEYLNYLITIGITGVAAYVTAIISIVYRALKNAKHNPLALVFLSAVIGYSAQAFINISQPITTPLFFIFLALTESAIRNADNNCNIPRSI